MPPPDDTVIPGSIGSPVQSADDVRAMFPFQAKGHPDLAPIREAITAGATGMFLAHQTATDYAAAQADVTRATSLYLDGQLTDRGVARAEDEEDEPYRERGLAVPNVVTPAAILARVNAILSQYTTIQAQLFHSVLDRTFIGAGTRPYAFIGRVVGFDPDYPDRNYDLRPNAHPHGAWVFRDTARGRLFVIRVPVLAGLDGTFTYQARFGVVYGGVGAAYIGAGSGHLAASFITTGEQSALAIYQTIANAIATIKGGSVRFILYADPSLVA
jgi:hypothetical protein